MFGQNKKKGKGFGSAAKSLRKKASQAGYKAANIGGYVAGRTSAKVAKTPRLRKIASKLPKPSGVPRMKSPSLRTQAAITKGIVSGTADSVRSSYRRN